MKKPNARKLPSGNWFCRVRVNGQDVSITMPTEKEAVAEAMAIKAGLKQPEPKADVITLSSAIDLYISLRDGILSPATIRGYRIIQQNRFKSLMPLSIRKITFQSVQSAVNAEAKKYSAKTVKNSFGLISAVLSEHAPGLDLSRIAMPMQISPEKRIYNEEQLRKLFAAIKGTDIEIPVLLATWLGLRRSEILGLRWVDIDFGGKTLLVHGALVQNEHNVYVEKQTKTIKSTRRLSCPDYLLAVLNSASRESERVVTMSPQTIRNHMVSIAKSAGIPFIGLHALRHTNASVMLSLNIADKYAMERGGWSSVKTMKDIYQHTMDAHRETANKAIDTYFTTLTDI